jgi:DNA-binding transcriptional regulator LsrR (DeoR family)
MASTYSSEQQKYEDAARAGWLYYVAGKTQDEIAKQFNISRQSAQRLVALAVSGGLIKVRLEHPIRRCMELAEELQQKFDLHQCEVVPSDDTNPSSTDGLAQAGAAEIERYLKSQQAKVIGLGTGRILRACADELSAMTCPQHRIISLVGNIAQDGSASRYDVAIHVAERVGARHYPMPLPVIAQTEDNKTQWHQLPHVANVQSLALQADIAFVGIGHLGTISPLHVDGFIAQHELAALDAMGAVGEVISWIFDRKGKLLDCDINHRVTSTPLHKMNNKKVIGIAAGEKKVPAINGAINSGLINGLITNEYTAKRLLAK